MFTAAIPSVLNRHLTTSGKMFDKVGSSAEAIERIFMAGQYAGLTAAKVNELKGNTAEAEKCQNISNGFASARNGLGIIRVVFPLEKLFTGKLIYQRYSAEDIKQAKQNHTFEDWMVEGALKKAAVDNSGELLKVNNTLIYLSNDSEEGIYLTRDWMDIVMDICVLAARLLSPVTWLHHLKAYDLGKHAKGIGTAIGSLWAVVITMSFVQNIRDVVNTVKASKENNDVSDNQSDREIRKSAADAIIGFFDFLSIPFDVFEMGMNAHPTIALVGCGIGLLSAGSYLAKETLYYQ